MMLSRTLVLELNVARLEGVLEGDTAEERFSSFVRRLRQPQAALALFPYRPETDQSGALLRALGGGVPAVVYDVGGLAEPVRRFSAGRVVPAGDVEALAASAQELIDDPEALAAARAGARRARDQLTWEAAAAAHLRLYEEIAG